MQQLLFNRTGNFVVSHRKVFAHTSYPSYTYQKPKKESLYFQEEYSHKVTDVEAVFILKCP